MVLYSILVFCALLICSCATSPNVNQHQWDVAVSPVDGKYATFVLLVNRKHTEDRGNSKYEGGMVVVASAGEGRKSDRSEWRINSADIIRKLGWKYHGFMITT